MSDTALTASRSISPPSPFSKLSLASGTPSRGPLGPSVTGFPPTFFVSISPTARPLPTTRFAAQPPTCPSSPAATPSPTATPSTRRPLLVRTIDPSRSRTRHPTGPGPGPFDNRALPEGSGSAEIAGLDALQGAGTED